LVGECVIFSSSAALEREKDLIGYLFIVLITIMLLLSVYIILTDMMKRIQVISEKKIPSKASALVVTSFSDDKKGEILSPTATEKDVTQEFLEALITKKGAGFQLKDAIALSQRSEAGDVMVRDACN
jgi:hypothetical protein